ncbi:MAG: hypothetical protein IJC68_01465, partial [Firmicutes bacterium]|nr:hypothetical protein [Bacillota bacterium]
MDEKDLQEFSLEDIIKEFSEPEEEIMPDAEAAPEAEAAEVSPEASQLPGETAEEAPEDAAAETAETTVPAAEPEEPETDPFAAVPALETEDEPTIRLPSIKDIPQEKSATDETIRLEAISDARGTVRIAQPITEEEEAKEAEPYSNTWEPQYEQPMGDYVPPPPIIFRPRSRLRELKRKLVAGPEKRYYELSEKGIGKLQIAIFLSFLVILLGAISTIMYSLGMVHESRMRLMVFIQFLAMLLSALLGSFQMLEGMGDLFRGRFTPNTLLFFTFVACCADGIVCLQQVKVPCCAAFSLEVTMSLWGAYQRRCTTMDQLDTMRKAIRLDSIGISPDYWNGYNGLLRGEGQVEDFMDTYDRPTAPDKALGIYSAIALLLGIGIGVGAGYLHGVSFGIRAGAVALLAAMPATVFITVSRPFAILERRLHALGTVLCGWKGISGLCGK